MRTLNDYFLPLGSIDLGDAGTSSAACCPDGGKIVGVSYSTNEAIDAAVTADVVVNGADSVPSTDISFPITADNAGGLALANASVYIADNDRVTLTGNAGASTGICTVTLIIRR